MSIDSSMPIPARHRPATIRGPVTIVTQPQSQRSRANQPPSPWRTPPAYTYQWQTGNADIADATNATLVLPAVATSDNTQFTCTVGNSLGSVIPACHLTVTTDAVAPTVLRVSADTSFTTAGEIL
jgi:hypothetical protein